MSGFRTETDGLIVTVNGNDVAKFDSTGKLLVGGSPVATESTKIIAGTAIATTSGTVHEFTGIIPSWAKRITVMIHNVSLSGTDLPIIQLGTGSVYTTTGYHSGTVGGTPGNVLAGGLNTNGFLMSTVANAGNFTTGTMVITNITGNLWTMSGTSGAVTAATNFILVGSKDVGGEVDSVRLTSVNGLNTFDSGTFNIFWE